MSVCSPVRLAVIGAGTISQSVHLPAVRRLGALFELAVVCDLSPSRAAQVAAAAGAGVRSTHDYDAVLADPAVDAVLLATPGTHAQAARAALEAGKHVLAEKPLSLTVAEAEELGALADARGLVLQVGYMKMYDPLTEVAAAELAALDTPRTVRVTVLHPADEPQVEHLRMPRPADDADLSVIEKALAYEAERTADALGEVPAALAAYYRDVLNGSVIHELSVLRALGFTLPTAFDTAELWPWPVQGEPPCLLATADLGDGARLVLNWNWLPDHPEYGEEIAVLARDGRLRLDMAAPYLVDVRSSLRVERAEHGVRRDSTVQHGYDTGFVRQLEEFAASVRDGAPVRSGAAGAAEDIRCLQALLAALAAREGAQVGGEAAGEENGK
ncbi:Gfo/Idh/MocA family oxidoreductase [Streptomyces sp. NPDC048290]|uniref:Gfo/Idh/MocA family protein n=1 Tax=Streptomyces sp. NPDC048290 TaxID=3155811 RepID=UPI00341DB2AA